MLMLDRLLTFEQQNDFSVLFRGRQIYVLLIPQINGVIPVVSQFKEQLKITLIFWGKRSGNINAWQTNVKS